jgi:hypothetical protein
MKTSLYAMTKTHADNALIIEEAHAALIALVLLVRPTIVSWRWLSISTPSQKIRRYTSRATLSAYSSISASFGLVGSTATPDIAAKLVDGIQTATGAISDAIDAGREPGMPLDTLARAVREAPLAALAIAFTVGAVFARRGRWSLLAVNVVYAGGRAAPQALEMPLAVPTVRFTSRAGTSTDTGHKPWQIQAHTSGPNHGKPSPESARNFWLRSEGRYLKRSQRWLSNSRPALLRLSLRQSTSFP